MSIFLTVETTQRVWNVNSDRNPDVTDINMFRKVDRWKVTINVLVFLLPPDSSLTVILKMSVTP